MSSDHFEQKLCGHLQQKRFQGLTEIITVLAYSDNVLKMYYYCKLHVAPFFIPKQNRCSLCLYLRPPIYIKRTVHVDSLRFVLTDS